MEIIKLKNLEDIDIGKASKEDMLKYWPRLLQKKSLGRVLGYNNAYLCEVREEIERLTIGMKDFLERFKKDPNLLDAREFLNREERDGIAYEWGAEPDYSCTTCADTMSISYYDTEKKKNICDLYSTPEVLQVLNQWIEYLEKWEKE